MAITARAGSDGTSLILGRQSAYGTRVMTNDAPFESNAGTVQIADDIAVSTAQALTVDTFAGAGTITVEISTAGAGVQDLMRTAQPQRQRH